MEWKKQILKDLLLVPIRNGLTKPSAIRGKGVKMIGMKEIFEMDYIRSVDMDRVPVTEKEYSTSAICENDLLFARQSLVLEGAGKCSIVTEVKEPTVFESHLIRLRIDPKKANPYFIYYYFKSSIGRGKIMSLVQQVAAAGIRGKELIELCIEIPTLDEQNKIADALKSLDDKIENNNRINRNLEAQAQALFKSWFVDFEPWGGTMPEDWEEGTLGEIAHVTSGKRPPLKQSLCSADIKIPLIGAADIMGYTNSVLYTTPILVTGRVGTHGIVQRFNEPCWPSDNTLVVEGKWYEYIYQTMCRIDYHNMNRGSTQPLITQTDLKNQKVIIPNVSILDKFETQVTILYKQVYINQRESARLAALRDTLLPKLMKGEIAL